METALRSCTDAPTRHARDWSIRLTPSHECRKMHASSAPPIRTYRDDIDGMRAVAVLVVVTFHAFPQALPGGFVGVDVFFVISGYLIGTVLLADMGSRHFHVGSFLARRVKRLVPALLVVLPTCLAFGWVVLFDSEYRKLGHHAVAGATFLSNFAYWREDGYFDSASEYKPLLHLWSLGVEWQFYVTWPIVMILALKRGWHLGAVTLAFGVISFGASIVMTPIMSATAFYLPPTRIWEFLAGTILAVAGASRPRPNSRPRRVLPQLVAEMMAFGGLAAILAAAILYRSSGDFPGSAALLPVLGAMATIGAAPSSTWARGLLSSRPLVFCGIISYTLYLWHWPLLSFARILHSGEPSATVRCAAVALSLALAILTTWLVEKPARRSRKTIVPVACLGLSGLVVALGFAAPAAKLASASGANGLVFHGDILRDRILTTFPSCDRLPFCINSTRPDASLDTVIVGDSHALYFYWGLAKALPEETVGLLSSNCLPLVGLDQCPQADQLIRAAAADPGIKLVVLTAFYAHRMYQVSSFQGRRYEDHAALFEAALRETFSVLQGAGKQVVFKYDVPTLDFKPVRCAERAITLPRTEPQASCSRPREAALHAHAPYRTAADRALKDYPDILVWDPFTYLCDAIGCHAKRGEAILYWDDNHLNLDAAAWLGDLFVADISRRRAALDQPRAN